MAQEGDPVRQFVMDYLVGLCGTIHRDNGFHTDIGKQVFADEDVNELQAPTPSTILEEGVEDPQGEGEEGEAAMGQYDRALMLSATAVETFGQDGPKRYARLMLADLQKLLGDENLKLEVPIGNGLTDACPLRIVEVANYFKAGGALGERIHVYTDWKVLYTTSMADPHIGTAT